jgi:hypothetical protein
VIRVILVLAAWFGEAGILREGLPSKLKYIQIKGGDRMFLGFVALVLGCFVFGIALGIVDGIRGGRK